MLRLYLAFFECSRTGTTSGTPPPPTDAATTTTSSTVTGSITINDIDL